VTLFMREDEGADEEKLERAMRKVALIGPHRVVRCEC
jgi:hypothetical protein